MWRRRTPGRALARSARPQIPPALKAHFASHNRQVILLAIAALVAALAFWILLYIFVEAIAMVAFTVSSGAEPHSASTLKLGYIAAACFVCALVFITQRFSRARMPRDHISLGAALSDLFLMLPRMTVFVWNGLRAWQRLDAREMRLAWRVLQRVEQERRVSLSSLPQDIPDTRLREKVVIALQLVELVEIHPGEQGFYMRFTNDKARALCQQLVRIAVES